MSKDAGVMSMPHMQAALAASQREANQVRSQAVRYERQREFAQYLGC